MVSIDLKDWKEVTKGIYVNPISANAAYEIHIKYWDMKTDILSANAELYIVGDWHEKDGRNIREREILLDYASVIRIVFGKQLKMIRKTIRLNN